MKDNFVRHEARQALSNQGLSWLSKAGNRRRRETSRESRRFRRPDSRFSEFDSRLSLVFNFGLALVKGLKIRLIKRKRPRLTRI